MHWRPRNARTQTLKQATFVVARNAKIPMLQRAHVICRVHFAVRRRRDIHNWMPVGKACVDGLVAAGVLPDDNDDHLLGPYMHRGIPQQQNTVVLEIREILDPARSL
jgi:crossover junction endodeoxyribonuclease RusA